MFYGKIANSFNKLERSLFFVVINDCWADVNAIEVLGKIQIFQWHILLMLFFQLYEHFYQTRSRLLNVRNFLFILLIYYFFGSISSTSISYYGPLWKLKVLIKSDIMNYHCNGTILKLLSYCQGT